jgi:hypothetical protein
LGQIDLFSSAKSGVLRRVAFRRYQPSGEMFARVPALSDNSSVAADTRPTALGLRAECSRLRADWRLVCAWPPR